MRAAWYTRTGAAAEVLQVGEAATPEPGPHEVRVRLHASGVNPSDVKSRRGRPDRPMPFPRIVPHSDGAGVIDALGAGVPAARLNERVWVWNAQWQRPEGTAADYVVLPAAQAVALPAGTDFTAGACLGIPVLTAWRAVTLAGPPTGRTLLVAGGAGSVGHYAIQIAKAKGARVLATVSSPEKAAHARAAGADAVIDYRREDVASRVHELTGGDGVDLAVEVDLGGNAALLPQVLRLGGTAAVYGSNTPEVTLPFGAYLFRDIALRFFVVYELPEAVRRAAIDEVTEMLDAGLLQHSIAARFPLERIAAAHEAVEGGRVIGHVVIDLA